MKYIPEEYDCNFTKAQKACIAHVINNTLTYPLVILERSIDDNYIQKKDLVRAYDYLQDIADWINSL